MKTTTSFAETIQSVLTTSNGVVDFVDRLLKTCCDNRLNCEWMATTCRVKALDGTASQEFNSPLGKAHFRTVLARISALLSEQDADSASPYGGAGTLLLEADEQKRLFRGLFIEFVNTPDEQWLQLRPTSIPMPHFLLSTFAPTNPAVAHASTSQIGSPPWAT